MAEFKRIIHKSLTSWLQRSSRKPLVLKGARQVGKSHAVHTLVKSNPQIKNFVELNLEQNPSYRSFFNSDLNPEQIVARIQLATGVNLNKPGSLLFIDEIQQEPRAIVALRYFHEQYSQLPVIAAGSLIEFVLSEVGFPVGRVDRMVVHPFTFVEFLAAIEKNHLADFINTHDFNTPVLEPIHNELLHFLKIYFYVGGMPAAVMAYYQTKDLSEVSKVQAEILLSYRDDFPKYAAKSDWDALLTVFDRSAHLIGNQRVKYVDFDQTIRSEKLKKSSNLLVQADILHKVFSTDVDRPPLRAAKQSKFFKIIFLDIGLMQALLGFDWRKISDQDDLTNLKNGALAEQFVGQEILATQKDLFNEVFYWLRNSKSSNAEVDYLIEKHGEIVPVEVKSGMLAKLKSLTMYRDLKQIPESYVLSQRNVEIRDKVKFLPLYLAGRVCG